MLARLFGGARTLGALGLLLTAATSCVDRVPAGLREEWKHRAAFSVQTVFPEIPPGGPVIPLSKVRGVLQSPSGEAVTAEGVFQNGLATLSFDVQLSTALDFGLDVTAFDLKDVSVYHSHSTVHVVPGEENATTPATLVYSAPDASVVSIKAAPTPLDLQAGATVQVTVSGTTAAGQPISPVRVGWTTRDATIVTVDDDGNVRAGAFQGKTWIVARTVGNLADSVPVSVRAPVAKIVFQPATVSVIRGKAIPVVVQLFDAGDHLIDDRVATLTIADPAKATMSAGVLAGLAVGTTTLTASIEGKTATANVTVLSPVDHIVLTTGPVNLASVGQAQSLTATVVARTGASVEGLVPAFTSSNPAVATVDATGKVVAKGNGSATITATIDDISATVSVAVKQAVASLTVAPTSTTVDALGLTQQYTATALDALGAVVTLGPGELTWSAGSPSIATVSASGLAKAVAVGTTTIIATAGGQSGSAPFTVRQAINLVTVTPSAASVDALGATRQYTANAFDAGGAPVPLAPGDVTWSVGTPSVATVSTTGLTTALAIGTTTVTATATAGGKSGSAQLTVHQAIDRVIVTPGSATVNAIGATQQFVATAFDANEAAVPIAPADINWTVASGTIASVSAAGLATALAVGTTSVIATVAGKSSGAEFTVQQIIAFVRVAPGSATIDAIGATQQFTASAFDANETPIPLAPTAFNWSTGSTAIATVNGTGLATAAGVGTTNVTATAGGKGGSAPLTVRQVIASVTVSPATQTVNALGLTQQYTASAADANGVSIPLASGDVSWSISSSVPPGVATVNATTGLATAVAVGTATVRATAGGKSSTGQFIVQQVATELRVQAATNPINVSGSTTVTAQLFDATGHLIGAATPVWNSEATNIATVAPTGTVSGVAAGTARIRGTLNGLSGFVDIQVTTPPGSTFAGRVVDANTGTGIANATLSSGASSTQTAADGSFSLAGVVNGATIDIAAANHASTQYFNAQGGGTGTTTQLGTLPLAPKPPNATGSLSGLVTNAVTGTGVVATVFARSGINATTGATAGQGNSAANGSFTITGLQPGTYTLSTSPSGYASATRTSAVVGDQTASNQNLALSPVGNGNQIRIVLTWGNNPADLDSHLTGPNPTGRFHVFWNAKTALDGTTVLAQLDLDDTNGNGPETITIPSQGTGVYRYYVYHFGGTSNIGSSGAQVTVYRGDVPIAQFFPPTQTGGGVGDTWSVFELNGTTITTINTISNTVNINAPPDLIPAPTGGVLLNRVPSPPNDLDRVLSDIAAHPTKPAAPPRTLPP